MQQSVIQPITPRRPSQAIPGLGAPSSQARRAAPTSIDPDPERVRFERAVLPWLQSLRHVALRLSRSGAEADDLVQETVLRAWRFWPRYTERDSCRAWLQRILANTFVSERRRAARERIVMALAESAGRAEQQPKTPEPIDTELDERLLGGLATLADEQRSVLWLVDVQDRSYREAAAELGWPIGTVMSRLHRARGALRRRLELQQPQLVSVL
jgi:RNA polymerase sigma-70 factor (ECF subfamily)